MKFIDLQLQYEHIKKNVNERIQRVLEHGQFIMGPEVYELEEKLADYVGVKHCITCSSGTDALLMSLMALGIKPNDEVIIPAFSFYATAEVILLLGATPVCVDIDPATYNIDTHQIEAAITERTKAIMPVSLYGQCADFKRINNIAQKHNLPVIEDGAQSFGATHHGRKSCSLTTIGCTSFFPTKPLGCYGDGGACFTDEDELAAALRQIRVHGQSGRYNHTRLGINGRLDTIQAAILLEKLDILEDEIFLRETKAANYQKHLKNTSLLTLPTAKDENSHVFGQYTVLIQRDRDLVIKLMKQQETPLFVHYPRTIPEQLASSHKTNAPSPISNIASQSVVSLPFGPYLTDDDQVNVIKRLIAVSEKIQSQPT
ncbi:DegT/DnrJ/EryC1/StrS family aminotransferase [Hahella aquimaris]|nr:DegT/DnrJ/EryC1/StrS family aminotransferase [Hahella sp. HNIBRBA332]WLQ17398.1 DegT/DnrJ/EryC1/StrS family aminotransferase [Hahella sp. HNIBRBA332]